MNEGKYMINPITSTIVFFSYLILFIILRIVFFNFAFKTHKRPLSMFYDTTLFIATTIWLITIREIIWFNYESSILWLGVILYVVAICDFGYNIYQFKNIKHSTN